MEALDALSCGPTAGLCAVLGMAVDGKSAALFLAVGIGLGCATGQLCCNKKDTAAGASQPRRVRVASVTSLLLMLGVAGRLLWMRTNQPVPPDRQPEVLSAVLRVKALQAELPACNGTHQSTAEARRAVVIGQPSSRWAVATLATCSWEERALALLASLRGTGRYAGDVVVMHDGAAASHRLRRAQADGNHVVLVNARSLFAANVGMPPLLCYGVDLGLRDMRKRQMARRAYFLKMALFSRFWLRWQRVLYVDAACAIHRPVGAFFGGQLWAASKGRLLANPDEWNEQPVRDAARQPNKQLAAQFEPHCDEAAFAALSRSATLGDVSFQSTLMLYDTAALIERSDATLGTLTRLYHAYSRIASGDQAILSLYFHTLRRQYAALPYRLDNTNEVPYDFLPVVRGARYIVTAWRWGWLKRPDRACEPPWNRSLWRPRRSCEAPSPL